MNITEVNITPVKPSNGLVAFASVVVDGNLYLSSIAVYTKLDGTYRLLYPTKNVGQRMINLFHPIHRKASQQIEQAVFEKCNELFQEGNDDDRHYQASDQIQ